MLSFHATLNKKLGNIAQSVRERAIIFTGLEIFYSEKKYLSERFYKFQPTGYGIIPLWERP